MAFPTALNDQVSDSVAQANVQIFGSAPAVAMGDVHQSSAQALSNVAHNAVTSQPQTNVIAQAVNTQGIALLYSLNTAATGSATTHILGA